MLLLLQNRSTPIHFQWQYTPAVLCYGMVRYDYWSGSNRCSFNPLNLIAKTIIFHFFSITHSITDLYAYCSTWSKHKKKHIWALECDCGFGLLSRPLFAFPSRIKRKKSQIVSQFSSSRKKWIENEIVIVMAEIEIRQFEKNHLTHHPINFRTRTSNGVFCGVNDVMTEE